METTVQPHTTIADLERQGFTGGQIARLRALSADYPLIEQVDSRRALDLLRFLKWRYATGRLDA
jgi:hypothetical protein